MQDKYSIYIIDEDTKNIKDLVDILKCYDNILITGYATSIYKGVDQVLRIKPDIIFIGIEFSENTGFDIADAIQSLKLNSAIVFTSNSDKYAYRSIKYRPHDYLIKPFTKELIEESIYKIISNLEYQGTKKYIFPQQTSDIVIDLEDIVYCRAENSLTTIYFSKEEKVVVSMGLTELIKKLYTNNFFKTHRSYLINLDYIRGIDRKEGLVVLAKGEDEFEIKITNQNVKELRALYS